jgi:hypothetical protein
MEEAARLDLNKFGADFQQLVRCPALLRRVWTTTRLRRKKPSLVPQDYGLIPIYLSPQWIVELTRQTVPVNRR